MSRSHNQTRCGRGCYVCGDKGASRRARERAWHKSDARADADEPLPARKTAYDKDRGLDPWGRY